jgi:hypothetical protein
MDTSLKRYTDENKHLKIFLPLLPIKGMGKYIHLHLTHINMYMHA